MLTEDLDEKFKDPPHPLRIVFVSAMWTTGFDVPSCSTIYLEKPMKAHTQMQTITRANRVFPGKNSGLIVVARLAQSFDKKARTSGRMLPDRCLSC